jgi:hypothetical protein
MAINFELWAECKDEYGISLLARHFEKFEHCLPTGVTVKAFVEIVNDPINIFGIRVSPSGLSGFGIRKFQDVLDTTEIGLLLYHHLKSASDFRFAHVGWEAENLTSSELSEWVETMPSGEKRFEIDCVVNNELYEQLGNPQFCYPFRDGYWWTRYKGEIYRPLYSDDQKALGELRKKLFQE